MAVACICLFVILPLNLIGTVVGRNWAGHPNFPCRVNAVPRPIPEKKWLVTPLVLEAQVFCYKFFGISMFVYTSHFMHSNLIL